MHRNCHINKYSHPVHLTQKFCNFAKISMNSDPTFTSYIYIFFSYTQYSFFSSHHPPTLLSLSYFNIWNHLGLLLWGHRPDFGRALWDNEYYFLLGAQIFSKYHRLSSQAGPLLSWVTCVEWLNASGIKWKWIKSTLKGCYKVPIRWDI